eukprot:CAMPEP_0206240416 /NCGR_PEP_ID=MMETSP0047_2-20121206/15928_1 /ASSEMBLY_ACC=CAM_ASM_000192 /TAXON_ID=195065 /ORGANISM="Chroomonas mesostigmatica_cf, Strain CCMP1168" /LENGTH=102 /DNA_ID=CAMNT_0053665199 /DNA_START=413 /DNA_END=718 /DNA_ORIENTATION=+
MRRLLAHTNAQRPEVRSLHFPVVHPRLVRNGRKDRSTCPPVDVDYIIAQECHIGRRARHVPALDVLEHGAQHVLRAVLDGALLPQALVRAQAESHELVHRGR